jgi:plastocyanin
MLLLAAIAGVAAGSTLATRSQRPADVRVVARDFTYVLSRKTVPVGRVRFTVVNRGSVSHDFAIGGRRTPLLRPGRSAVITVTFAHGGNFAYRCTVSGHAALGMKGTLKVGKGTNTRGATSPSTTTTGSTTTTPAGGLTLTKIGDFQRPVLVAAPRGDPDHLFVVEQRGTVQEVVTDRVL